MATQRLGDPGCRRGRQPLTDPRGQIVVSQNGELLNADSLRSELVRQGHAFRSHCDTEVWPALYLSVKTDAFCARRDSLQWRCGIGQIGRCISPAIGWESVRFTAHRGAGIFAVGVRKSRRCWHRVLWESEVDREGIDLVFTPFAAGTKRTAFRNICSLSRSLSRVRSGDIAAFRYWDLDFPPQVRSAKTDRKTDR